MAQVTSGSVSTNSITGYGLTTSFTLSWSATQSTANNTSTISWNLTTNQTPTGSGYQRTIYNAFVTIDGTTYNLTNQTSVSNGTVLMSSSSYGTKTITHNTDGTKSFSISVGVSVGQSSNNCTGSDTFELTTIPRYTSITSFTVAKRNETSLTFNWQTADTIDYAWYSTDNGSTWTGYDVTDGTSGSFNVGSLSPNTTYNCKIRVRRKDSQLNTTYSSYVAQTTYKVPTQSLNSKTEVSIKMNWSVDSTADYIWYSTNNGSSWTAVGSVNATSGTYEIQSLSASTTYNIKTRVRRSASQTTYDTTALSVTTASFPAFTAQPTYSARTETTLDVTYKPNMTVGSAQYRIKASGGSYGSWATISSSNIVSGSATTTTGCTFRISGLTANTNYVVQVRLKSALTDNYTNSSEVSTNMYTYAYPYITAIETSNLTIGNSQKVTLYNPLGRTVTIKMNQNNTSGTELYSGTTSNTSSTFTPTKSTLYASIPSATSGNCVYSVTYGSVVTTLSGTYTINANECKPTFSDFAYSTNLSELTGNNATIVNGETTTTFTISTANKAIGNYSATITKYRLECGNQTTDVAYSSSASVSGTIANCTNQNIKVTAIDSRGLETSVQKAVTNYKAYSKPSFRSITADRNDGVETTTKLNFRLNYWNDSFGSVTNSIVYVAYRSKLTTASDYGSYTSIPISNLTLSSGIATLSDYLIHSNGSSGGFEIGKAYNIQVMVRDGSSSYTLETIYGYPNVTDGNVAFSTFQDSNGKYHSGFNGMPDASYTNTINGNEKITNSLRVLGYTDTNKLILEEFEEGHNLDSGGGTSGYWYVCDITSTSTYQDQPIEFYIIQRVRYGKIYIRTTGSGTTGVLGIGYAYIEGHTDFNAYYYYADNKIQLYVQKQQGWDNADVYVKKARYMRGINIAWKGTTVSSLPTNYVTISTNTKKLNISGNASTATTATSATSATNATNAQTLKYIDLTGVTTTILAQVKALGSNGITGTRVFFSTTDGGTSNISDKPTGTTNAGFACEVICNRMASTSDYRYQLICRVQNDKNAYNAVVEAGTSSISWTRANTTYTFATGDSNGQIKVTPLGGTAQNVSVKGLSTAAYKGVTRLTSKSYVPYSSTNLVDVDTIAFWNGAYNSSNSSNLTYAHQGTIQCKPTNLYNNSSGTTGTVTLSETSANFNYIDIWFQGNNKTIDFVRVYSPNGKGVNLHTANSNGTNTWLQMNVCRISGTSITREGKYEHTINNSVVAGLGSGNYVYILRVDGYK